MSTKLALVAVWAQAALAANPLGPGAGEWNVESPEQHGIDPAHLDEAWQHMKQTAGGPGCMIVVKDGAIIYEVYNDGLLYNRDLPTYSWSSTKTLGALLVGKGVTDGKIDIDANTDIYNVSSPKDYPVTSRQIMSQALGGDKDAGESFVYDGAGVMWIDKLVDVVRNAMGVAPSEIWTESFQKPLGLSESWSWNLPSADRSFATGSAGTCQDWARIGQLVLNKGEWADSEPLVQREYMEELVKPQTRYNGHTDYASTCYGLLTWLNYHPDPATYPGKCIMPTGETVEESAAQMPAEIPKDINFIAGALGQVTMQFPSEKMTVTTMGATLPRGTLWPHHIASRLAEATWCKAMPGDRCGWRANPQPVDGSMTDRFRKFFGF